MQKALERHTFIYTWDDHETANDHSYNAEENSYDLSESHPLYGSSPERRRRLAYEARKAWLEYTPMCFETTNSEDPQTFFKLYKKYSFSNLLDIHTTDSRTYRQVKKDDNQSDMLGEEQTEWLKDNLISSEASWRVWANQTYFSELAIRGPITRKAYAFVNEDAWDGFRSKREDILNRLSENDVNNLVVLTGDMHTYISSYVKRDFSLRRNKAEDVLGVELMTPSISSNNLNSIIGSLLDRRKNNFTNGPATNLEEALCENIEVDRQNYKITDRVIESVVKTANKHIKSFNSNIYGYMTIIFKEDELFWKVYSIDREKEIYSKEDKKLLSVQSYQKNGKIKGR